MCMSCETRILHLPEAADIMENCRVLPSKATIGTRYTIPVLLEAGDAGQILFRAGRILSRTECGCGASKTQLTGQ
jgi:hypothetical protein